MKKEEDKEGVLFCDNEAKRIWNIEMHVKKSKN